MRYKCFYRAFEVLKNSIKKKNTSEINCDKTFLITT